MYPVSSEPSHQIVFNIISTSNNTTATTKIPIQTINHGLYLRQADSRTGSHEEMPCGRGKFYGTVDRLFNDIRYNQDIQQYFADNISEIISTVSTMI